MDEQQLLKIISRKEIEYGCYDAEINGVPIYSLLRRYFRQGAYKNAGLGVMKGKSKTNKTAVVQSAIKSLWHLCKIFCGRQQYKTVFYAFPRVDKINGVYLDKFTDPLIEICGLDDYIILEHSRGGERVQPRMHSKKIVCWDSLHVYSEFYANIFYKMFEYKYKSEFNKVLDAASKALGVKYDRGTMVKVFLKAYVNICGIRHILRHVKAKQLIAPARSKTFHIAARQVGVKVLELQHGITYGESELYSGYRDPLVIPDYFLAFGENRPLDVYGIEESKIVNIGFALNNYLANLSTKRYGDNDILVVSDPNITTYILNAVIDLADHFPNSVFYVRPHPHEVVSQEHYDMIRGKANIMFQDNSLNITEVMAGFNYVIGENSTVVYEAMSAGKRVGRLFYEGLHIMYMNDEDRQCFWEIRNIDDFKNFLNGKDEKRTRSIYSQFDKAKFLEIAGIKE